MPFSFRRTSIDGLAIIEPRVFEDTRGWFLESYRRSEFIAAGMAEEFVQDNRSVSAQGALRGLHFQRSPKAQGKLVAVTAGRAWDVAVDLRNGSPTFGRWHGLELSCANRLSVYIPPGFAHGFLALDNGTELSYKCTEEYDPTVEAGIRWDDPTLAIVWPTALPKLSPKDAELPYFDPRYEYFD